ncbi:MAG: AAA family ATPase [Chloroflexota bacterium]
MSSKPNSHQAQTTSSSANSPTTSTPNFKTLSGVVERVTFQSDETGYTVARFLPDRPTDRQATNNNSTSASPRFRATKGDDNLLTVVGTMVGVVAGEALELTGLWLQHPQHGWQFKVENYRSVLPATEQGLRKYMGSGLIKGIGPKTADKIVAHFGLETLDILENTPDRLIEVPKLGKHKVGLIAKAWLEQKAIKEVMLFLQGQGISTSLAVRIYKEYGDASITIVKNEPYRLAREVWGIGFKTADKIAQALGFAIDDPERIKAGTLYVLSEASDSGGHTYLPRPQLALKAAELLGVTPEQVETAIEGLVLDGGAQVETLTVDPTDGSKGFVPLIAVTVYEPGKTAATSQQETNVGTGSANVTTQTTAKKVAAKPNILTSDVATYATKSPSSASVPTAAALHESVEVYVGSTPTLSALPGEQAVYLPPFYFAEQGIANHLLRLAHCSPQQDRLITLKQTNFATMFEYLTTKESLKLADRQEEGVVMALTKPVGVLTGGPGTGKTTSMRALIRVLTLKKKRIILAAPTGRAAKRLSEATGLEAKTLHRLLQLKPGGKSQYDHRANPIPADIVIVDETSMLDTLLMNTLLKGIATGTHLLLVGDADQLPSVGAGNVLADVIGSAVVPVVKLEQIFRQGEGSAIVTNAHRINQGQMPLMGKEITDFFFFGEDDPELAGDLVVDLVAKRIPVKFGFKPEEIQVLSPMHRGKCGVGYLNEKLQEVLNPPSERKGQKQYGGKLFRVGDKVLQLRNNYEKEVFNGDSGVLMALSHEDQVVTVKLEDGREAEYDFGELDELTLAYALSIHKSQGSEYPVCVIPLAMGHYMLLERKLIYTAVTRAKKLVVLVGSKKALAMAVRNGPKRESEEGTLLSAVPNNSGKDSSSHRAGRYTGLTVRLLHNQN